MDTEAPPRPLLGGAQAAAATTMVGSSVAVAAVISDYPLLTGQAGRYALAALVLAVWMRLTGRSLALPQARDLGWIAATAAVGLAAFNVFLIAATARVAPSLVGAIVGTVPVVLAVVGAVQARRRPSARVVAAAVIVTVGAALVQQAQAAADLIGVLFAVGAMVSEVGFSLLAVPALRRIGPAAFSLHACWIAAALLAVGGVALEVDALRAPTAAELLSLVYLAVFVTAVAFVLWYSGLGRLGADVAGVFAGIIPVSALAIAVLIGTDKLSTGRLLGVVLVGSGVLLGVTGAQRRPGVMPAAPPT